MPDRWAIFDTPNGRMCWQLGDLTDAQVPAAMNSARQKLGVPAGWQNDPAWDFSVSTGVPHPKTLGGAAKVYGPDGSMKTAAELNALIESGAAVVTAVTQTLAAVGTGLGGVLGGLLGGKSP